MWRLCGVGVCSLGLQHGDNAVEVFHSGEFDNNLAFFGTHVDFHVGVKVVTEGVCPVGQFLWLGPGCVLLFLCGFVIVSVDECDSFFCGSDREPFGNNAFCELGLGVCALCNAHECTCMASGEDAGGYATLDGDRKLKEPNGVGDDGAGASQACREFCLGDPEFFEELLIGGAFF